MKYLVITLNIFLMVLISNTSFGYYFISKIDEWPYIPYNVSLNPAPGALLYGSHTSGDILFWAIGDTITILDPNGSGTSPNLNTINTIRVKTESFIHNMRYDNTPGEEILYVSAGRGKGTSGGLKIYDISDLTAPALLGFINSSTHNPGVEPDLDNINEALNKPEFDTAGLAFFNGLLYLADNHFGLRVIDVSTDPKRKNPLEMKHINPEDCEGASPADPDRCLAENTPDDERIISFKRCNDDNNCISTGGFLNLDLAVFSYKGSLHVYVVVHDYYYGLRIFDATGLYITEDTTDPLNPVPFTDPALLVPDFHALKTDLKEVASKDLRTYITATYFLSSITDLRVVKASDKADTLYAFVTSSDSTLVQHAVTKLEIYLDKIGLTKVPFPADGNIYDHPIINYGRGNTEGHSAGIAISDDQAIAYVADGNAGLKVVDMKTEPPGYDPYAIGDKNIYEIIGQLPEPETAPPTYDLSGSYSCTKSGTTLYLGAKTSGLHKIDITDNTAPAHMGEFPQPMTADAVFADNKHVYFLDQDEGMRILDTRLDTYSYLRSFFDNNVDENGNEAAQTAYSVFVSSNVAFLANGTGGLRMINVTASSSPVLISDKVFTGTAGAVAVDVRVDGAYAYLAAQSAGLAVIHVANTSLPGEPIFLDTTGSAEAIAVDGDRDYVYIANGANGLVTADVADKSAPVIVGSVISIPGTSVSVDFFKQETIGNDGEKLTNVYACVASDTGIHITDITDPATPGEVVTWNDYENWENYDGTPADLSITDTTVSIAMGTGGVVLLDISDPLNPVKDYSYPMKGNTKAVYSSDSYVYTAIDTAGVSVFKKYDSSGGDVGLGDQLPTDVSDDICFISSVH